jgi:hypothetical protein
MFVTICAAFVTLFLRLFVIRYFFSGFCYFLCGFCNFVLQIGRNSKRQKVSKLPQKPDGDDTESDESSEESEEGASTSGNEGDEVAQEDDDEDSDSTYEALSTERKDVPGYDPLAEAREKRTVAQRKADAKKLAGKNGIILFVPLEDVPASWEAPEESIMHNYALFRVRTGPTLSWPWSDAEVYTLKTSAIRFDNSREVVDSPKATGLPRCECLLEDYGNYVPIIAWTAPHNAMPSISMLNLPKGSILKPSLKRTSPRLTKAGTISASCAEPISTGKQLIEHVKKQRAGINQKPRPPPILVHYSYLFDPGNPTPGQVITVAKKKVKKK